MPAVERLTKRLVDATRPPDSGELLLWDSEVSGFGLRVRAGGSKTYVVKYGVGRRGKARRVTIGRHGSPWTTETARDEARRLLGLVAFGNDPAAARALARNMPTVEEFAQRYINEHASAHKKAGSVQADRGLLTRVILPRLGNLRLDKVTRSDVATLHLARHDTPTDANRMLALLSRMFTLAELWGLRPTGSNPCKGVPRYKETKRERYLSEQELVRLGAALGAAERDGSESPFVLACVKLLVFTGARLSEILTLRWPHVDFHAAVLRLPDSKTGAKLVRLNPAALEVLTTIPRVEGNPHVIAGEVAGQHFVGIQHAWQRVRDRAGLGDVRLHDLRHSFASVAAAGGASLPIIGALLGHSQAATTHRYAHLSDDPLRAVASAVGARLSAALQRGASSTNGEDGSTPAA